MQGRSGRGIRRDRVVQESLITVDGKAFCSCMKPKLLHLPCSHLIAACAESGLQPGVFVSPYFSKETAVSTWGHEVYGIGIVGSFIQDNENKMFIPDPATKKGKGRRQTVVCNGFYHATACVMCVSLPLYYDVIPMVYTI